MVHVGALLAATLAVHLAHLVAALQPIARRRRRLVVVILCGVENWNQFFFVVSNNVNSVSNV